jgi:hypothetical protein
MLNEEQRELIEAVFDELGVIYVDAQGNLSEEPVADVIAKIKVTEVMRLDAVVRRVEKALA